MAHGWVGVRGRMNPAGWRGGDSCQANGPSTASFDRDRATSRCDQARCLAMFVFCPCGHDTKVAVASLDAARRSPRSPSYSPAIELLSTRRTPSDPTLPLPTFTSAARFLAGAVMSLKENNAPRVSDLSTSPPQRLADLREGALLFFATVLAYLPFPSLCPLVWCRPGSTSNQSLKNNALRPYRVRGHGRLPNHRPTSSRASSPSQSTRRVS